MKNATHGVAHVVTNNKQSIDVALKVRQEKKDGVAVNVKSIARLFGTTYFHIHALVVENLIH